MAAAAYVVGLGIAFVPQIVIAKDVFQGAFEDSYVLGFARALGECTDERTKLAVTEAGRIPYFVRGKILDLVGLNTAETARTPPTRALLESFHPDLVMIHPAGTIDEHLLGTDADLIPLEPPLGRLLLPWVQALRRDALPAYRELRLENIRVAPPATIQFLDAHPGEFDLFAARFEGRFVHYHLYAIRRAWDKHDDVARALKSSHAPARGSYLEMTAQEAPIGSRLCATSQ
jgi:hypothetical protein